MNRQQKNILIVLAALNLALFVAMGGFALWWTSSQPPEITIVTDPCMDRLLNELPPETRPAVTWTATHVTLAVTYPPQTGEALEGESGQYLWTVLDVLSTTTASGCTLPQQVTLCVTVPESEGAYHHVANLSGQDVAAWVQNGLTDAALAERSRYRQINRQPAP